MGNMQNKSTFDANLELKDSYAVTASAAAQVDSAAKVLDLGGTNGTPVVEGKAIFDVSAINNSAAANKYTLAIEGSTTSAFSTKYVLAKIELGHATATGEAAAKGTGQWVLPFSNEVNGTPLRYIRHYVTIAGSPVTITHTARVAVK